MFQMAKPVFPAGKTKELNCFAAFRTTVAPSASLTLRLTAFGFYRAFVNGTFAGFGPARTAKGYARMDELDISKLADRAENEIVVEVAGYYCRSLSTAYQPSFFMAEVVANGEVTAYTGRDFEAFLPTTRLQKVERYSVQRHFSEVWDFIGGKDLTTETRTACEVLKNAPEILPRVAVYPDYFDMPVKAAASCGRLQADPSLPVHRDFYSFQPDARWGCFAREEVKYHPYEWIQGHRQIKAAGETALPVTLREGEYVIFDLGRIETGFLTAQLAAARDTSLVIGFSEEGSPDAFAFTDMHSHNAMQLLLPAGESRPFMSFEPYVMKYVILAAASGEVRIDAFGIKNFAREIGSVHIKPTGDEVLDVICQSGVRTFAHNALDIYMDCPSRERAGWLCDSYFTGQVEHALYGSTEVEDAFLENYRIYRNEGEYPEGVLPMCYPSDPQTDHKFIPQWTMWYILEVEQYINLRNPKADKEAFRPTIEGLLAFYDKYINEDGLLEKLPSWNFVEWSVANDWTHDVSYPTNLLYAEVLQSVYRLYGGEEHLARSEHIRAAVLAQSFNGEVFLDHAVRGEDGVLVTQKDCSEACQYYAMLFGGYDWHSPRFEKLRSLVLTGFGSMRNGARPDIAEVNAFIGAYLRIEALLRVEEYELVLQEAKFFFGQMGNETATLWEYRQRHGSRDHGFASYALVAIQKAMSALEQH